MTAGEGLAFLKESTIVVEHSLVKNSVAVIDVLAAFHAASYLIPRFFCPRSSSLSLLVSEQFSLSVYALQPNFLSHHPTVQILFFLSY